MASPFPGMDPFIESQMWDDFHTRFVTAISDALVPSARPKYVVNVERRVYLETHDPETPAKTFVADVGIVEGEFRGSRGGVPVVAETVVEPKKCVLPDAEEHREAFLVIRRVSPRQVVTVIELLSPTNKLPRSDGRQHYLDKRQEIIKTSTHLVELDLLRGGQRMPCSDPPAGDYFAIVSRAARRPVADVYGWPLGDALPTIPIPLADDDPDIPLALQQVFDLVYERAGYDYSLDDTQPVSPPLAEQEAAWAERQLASCR